MPLLDIHNLKVKYGAITAVHDISLTVDAGEIVTLIGANGAGKSTTLRAVSGLLRPCRGTIQFAGNAITHLAPHCIVRHGLAQVPEGRGIFSNLTIEENLDLGTYTRTCTTTIAQDYDEIFARFPRLRERRKQNAGTLSGGEQQMLAIARALLAKPKLLLLDEPSLGLAPQLVHTIFQIIQSINRAGTTILLVEQNAHMALQIAHRAYVVECGRITMSGDAKTLAGSEAIQKAYLGIG